VSPTAVSAITFVIILGGACVGAVLRRALPGRHLTDDAKDVVRLGAGLVGTIAALVLGLLIASAKTSYDSQSNQVHQMTADVVLLDRILGQYGPETHPVRDLMRRAIGPLTERIWQQSDTPTRNDAPFTATPLADDVFARLGELDPQTDTQRLLKARAIQVSTDLAQARLLLFEQSGKSIPVPFLAVLVFWLAMIFASFSLFARLNATLVAALFVFAFSASAAIFLILEMGQPFGGLMEIPSAPLRNALASLGP
jgi:hypothetical protein